MSDKTINPTVRHVARVTIQLQTPLHLGSGLPGEFSDADLVYDANGLPAIPGSSIAGVLRSLHGKDSSEADDIFGFQKGNANGQGSRLSISWACIHSSENLPIEGLSDPSAIAADPLLRLARQPSLRDHVRITHMGVADAEGHGKFDELSLQIGHRFTFEMELRGPASQRDADADKLQKLVGKLAEPGFRLGGKTRRGFGAVEVQRVISGSFDLANVAERERYLMHPVSLVQPSPVLEPGLLGKSKDREPFAKLALKPRGFWMFGGGVDVDVSGKTANWKASDMAPVRDTVVKWENDTSKPLENCLIIPGSSIKGAIAHRTAYHFNCLEGRFIDLEAADPEGQLKEYTKNPAIDELFGSAKDGESGERGHVLIDDSFLQPEETSTRRIPHVSIDRFTGGALDGALFDERPAVGGEIEVTVHLDQPCTYFSKNALEALRRALSDLAEGRLALGAGVGRGNGFFEGTLTFREPLTEKASA